MTDRPQTDIFELCGTLGEGGEIDVETVEAWDGAGGYHHLNVTLQFGTFAVEIAISPKDADQLANDLQDATEEINVTNGA